MAEFHPHSRGQILFDVFFGILLPLICLIADPFVFVYNPYRLAAYGFCGLQMILLSIWLAFGRRLTTSAPKFGGAFILATIACLALGLILAPFSALGVLAYGIGFLGFTPFVTAYVFWHNGRRAFARAAGHGSRVRVWGSALIAATVVLTAPILMMTVLTDGLGEYDSYHGNRFSIIHIRPIDD